MLLKLPSEVVAMNPWTKRAKLMQALEAQTKLDHHATLIIEGESNPFRPTWCKHSFVLADEDEQRWLHKITLVPGEKRSVYQCVKCICLVAL